VLVNDTDASKNQKIVIPGGAGLVGQNLVTRLLAAGYSNLVVLDKHAHNLGVLHALHPDVTTVSADLSEPGDWAGHFDKSQAVVMLQAQIGASHSAPFEANNVRATERVLAETKNYGIPYLVHVSSSVVRSVADDDYTRTKRLQEQMVVASGIDCVVLRPTLMFGWFDRKHLGWLARFMRRIPVFPIPGSGRFARQPLYVGDFCAVIQRCLERRITGTYDISGVQSVDYVDMIRAIREAVRSRTLVLPIPFRLFDLLLKTWALLDKDPPFTSAQLHALVAGDNFEVTDWPERFDVPVTSFADAIKETFTHPVYSTIELKF
jgi:uncharacterized protein YbjT (DUF2867 family)